MGPVQRTPGAASAAFSQDHPWLRCCERISLVKNRMREICTSGSVRGGGGNVPTYSALLLPKRREMTQECTPVGESLCRAKDSQLRIGMQVAQPTQQQTAEQ